MITDDDLLEAFHNAESDRIERKRNADNLDKIRELICAMANDMPNHNKPGIIFIGQEDDLTCSGLDIDDKLLLRLSQLRDDGNIQPLPQMEVRSKIFQGCKVAVITVAPSDQPPVKFNGRVYIRVGPRRAFATGQEERRLLEKRRWGNLPFDAQPFAGSALNDLDFVRFKLEFLPAVVPQDVLSQNDRSDEQQLRTLKLVGLDGTPTIAGLLFLGKSPQSLLPGAYIQFRKIDGTHLTDETIVHHEITGSLIDQIRRIDELLSLFIKTSAKVGGPVRIEKPDYPLEALRQLVRNAIIHRTYEGTNAPVRITWYVDRIEILSPGGPYGSVTHENFGNEGVTDYRNPTIAELMLRLKFVEKYGVGIGIARRTLAENENPPLEFDKSSSNHILAIVRTRT
jgi:ATP-dependent DNA helicase RecG